MIMRAAVRGPKRTLPPHAPEGPVEPPASLIHEKEVLPFRVQPPYYRHGTRIGEGLRNDRVRRRLLQREPNRHPVPFGARGPCPERVSSRRLLAPVSCKVRASSCIRGYRSASLLLKAGCRRRQDRQRSLGTLSRSLGRDLHHAQGLGSLRRLVGIDAG